MICQYNLCESQRRFQKVGQIERNFHLSGVWLNLKNKIKNKKYFN